MTERFLLLEKEDFFEFIDSEEAYFKTTDLGELLSIAEDTLNEQDQRIQELGEDNHDLKFELSKHVGDGEWNIRDITCMAGKFRLEEWGERYHQFYDGDTELEDEAVVIMLLENKKLIEELKERIKELTHQLDSLSGLWVTDQAVTDDDKNKYHMWRLK